MLGEIANQSIAISRIIPTVYSVCYKIGVFQMLVHMSFKDYLAVLYKTFFRVFLLNPSLLNYTLESIKLFKLYTSRQKEEEELVHNDRRRLH